MLTCTGLLHAPCIPAARAGFALLIGCRPRSPFRPRGGSGQQPSTFSTHQVVWGVTARRTSGGGARTLLDDVVALCQGDMDTAFGVIEEWADWTFLCDFMQYGCASVTYLCIFTGVFIAIFVKTYKYAYLRCRIYSAVDVFNKPGHAKDTGIWWGAISPS